MISLYRLHPQQTSLRDALEAARRADLEGRVVLDPFCGTGTLVFSAIVGGASVSIGSDIEDWSAYLRPQLRQRFWTGVVELYWHIDAMRAIKLFEHDVLFTDPPNPSRLVGSALISLVRDFHISGSELAKMFESKLSERNLMGKKDKTIHYVIELIQRELGAGRRVILHAFKDSGRSFDWKRVLAENFDLGPIHKDYVEVV